MKSKIIEIATERTLEQNLASIASEYFKTFNKNHLPIIGTIDQDLGLLVLVADASVQQELMHVVNAINQRSYDAV